MCAALQTLLLAFEAISIASTTTIVELTTLTKRPIKDPLECIVGALPTLLWLVADINLAWSWSGWRSWWASRFRLLLAACITFLLAGKPILVATATAVVELTTGSVLGVVVPSEAVVGTLTNVRGKIANVLS